MLFRSRYVCKAQKPDCPNCNISDLCEYKHKTPDPLAQPAGKIPKRTAKAPAKKVATKKIAAKKRVTTPRKAA